MFKKIVLMCVCVLSLILSGCSQSKQIDKASIAEIVTVFENEGKTYYSFYFLSSSDTPVYTTVCADSFESACEKARNESVSNLMLTKLELFVTEESVARKTLKNDIEFISRNSYLSPLMYVTLCDSGVVEMLGSDKEFGEKVSELIILNTKKDSSVSVTPLSIFNSFSDNNKKELALSYINSNSELKSEIIKINP